MSFVSEISRIRQAEKIQSQRQSCFQPAESLQETTDKNEITIRKTSDEKEAQEFVKHRMEYYDKLWDGCSGCKIDYFN